MTLQELFQAAIKNKQGRVTVPEVDRREIYHKTYRPGMVIEMSDRRYVVAWNGMFVRVPE